MPLSLSFCRSSKTRGIGSNAIVETGAGLPTFVTPKYALFIPCYVVTSLRHDGNHPPRDRADDFNRVSLTMSDTGHAVFDNAGTFTHCPRGIRRHSRLTHQRVQENLTWPPPLPPHANPDPLIVALQRRPGPQYLINTRQPDQARIRTESRPDKSCRCSTRQVASQGRRI